MGTSKRKGSTKAVKAILNSYMDKNTKMLKEGKEKEVCQKITKEYLGRRKNSRGYFDPEKMSNLMCMGFGAFKKAKVILDDEKIKELEINDVEEKIREFLETEEDEIHTEEDEQYRRAFIEAMTGAILADKDKDKVFIENLIVNIIKLGVISELDQELIERYDSEISYDFNTEIEKCVKESLEDCMENVYLNVTNEKWEVLSELIEKTKKKVRGEKNV